VLQLYDATAGRATTVRPARPGELRIWVATPAEPRSSLLADLIRRVAERHYLRASVWQPQPVAWVTLNIHPAELSARPPDLLDVVVGQAGEPAGAAARLMRPGAVQLGAPDVAGLDPLALRLAFLERPYREPAVLSRETLVGADQTLRRWRSLVAGWAHSPSKPMCARYTGDVLGAFDDDLGSPAALRALDALAADAEIPPGAKFEAFAYLDQLFGLDLAREIGQ
jgi:hypothetical protein